MVTITLELKLNNKTAQALRQEVLENEGEENPKKLKPEALADWLAEYATNTLLSNWQYDHGVNPVITHKKA